MARDFSTRSYRNDGTGPKQSLGLAWLSVPFLLLSVLVPSLFATQQMSFLRRSGPDLHVLGAAVCTIAAIIGAIAFLRMIRHKPADRNYKTATVATLAGTVIFILGAVVISSTDNETAPRVGGIHGEAVQ
jgi:ABC-type enterochelin transport system permease subunit